VSAALTGHGLKQVTLPQAVEPAAIGGFGKVGTTLRSFLGYFALRNDELNIRNDFFFHWFRGYRAFTDINVFLIRHGMYSLFSVEVFLVLADRLHAGCQVIRRYP